MKIEYVIVQAGGKGTRLGKLTHNRPKALVSINNRPIIFHLFEKFPDCRYVIIGDYKYGVLEKYLDNFAKVSFASIKANGKGNATGIATALNYIPQGKPFMLLWSDLLIDDKIDFDSLPYGNYVGITNKFSCSWKFENNLFEKTQSNKNGLVGFFIFKDKSVINGIPEEGSFAQWIQKQSIDFFSLDMLETNELGTLDAIKLVDHSNENRCRPYNKMIFDGEKVIKEGVTSDGKELIKREIAWYKYATEHGFTEIPTIHSFEPLTMSKIHGENIFKANLTEEEKKITIKRLVESLLKMHEIGKSEQNAFDMQEDYYAKTLKRLYSIWSCIPHANEIFININGKKCQNILVKPELLQKFVDYTVSEKTDFGLIHGDGTLTNTMIDYNGKIYFIDARGYFGKTPLIGDVNYDWAKLYYSVNASFDQFNIKNFDLNINEDCVNFKIAASGWEKLTEYMFSIIPNCNIKKIKFIHSIIWLSLASHCWEDYDSMCLAFYNGLYLLNELM